MEAAEVKQWRYSGWKQQRKCNGAPYSAPTSGGRRPDTVVMQQVNEVIAATQMQWCCNKSSITHHVLLQYRLKQQRCSNVGANGSNREEALVLQQVEAAKQIAVVLQ